MLSGDALIIVAQLSFVVGLFLSLGVVIPFVMYKFIFKKKVVKKNDTKEIKTVK